MADEPDNLVLSLLREIRGVQDEHSAELVEHDQRFDELKKQTEARQEITVTGVGFAAHANLCPPAIEKEITDLKSRIMRLEDAR